MRRTIFCVGLRCQQRFGFLRRAPLPAEVWRCVGPVPAACNLRRAPLPAELWISGCIGHDAGSIGLVHESRC
eukprot:6928087-Prymnesium_polylepis.1